MNLLLLHPDEVVPFPDEIVLRDRRAAHVRDVLRAIPGTRLRTGIAGGAVGEAEVTRVTPDAVGLRFVVTGPAPAPIPVDLILAVPRPKVLRRTLAAAAAMAVRRIDLVNAWRVDKSYLGSARLAPSAIGEDLWLGAEQGGTTHLPAVAVHRRLMAFLDAGHPRPGTARPGPPHALCAHARGGVDVEAALPAGATGDVVLAIGPEGGWIEREVETFAARGFAIVRLGAPILRVEAAVVAALAQIALLRRLAPA